MSTQDNNEILKSSLEQLAESREALESIENLSAEMLKKQEDRNTTNPIATLRIELPAGERNKLKGDKGDKGETGAKGENGEKGEGGEKGDSIKGEEGRDGKEGPVGPRGPKGETGEGGETGKAGNNGKDGNIISSEEVRDKLSDLKGEERLDASAIKNLMLPRGKGGKMIIAGAPNASSFLKLEDTPKSYAGQVGKAVKVKSTGDGLEFGSAGHTIRENGTDQTARTGLNFVDADAGAGLVTDDSVNDETEVNLDKYTLLAGRAGGQTIIGGTASGEDLTLQSTSHATRGTIILDKSVTIPSPLNFQNSFNIGDTGGIQIGAITVRGTTEPTNAINLFNGTAPAGTLTNGATIYAQGGKIYAADSTGDIRSITTAILADVNAWTGQQTFAEATLTDGATIDWNLNTQQVAKVTLAGNRTLALPTNIVAGGIYTLTVIQDATGSRTLAWNAGFLFPAGIDPVSSTGANDIDIYQFKGHGTTQLILLTASFDVS